VASTHHYILFFTNRGRCYWLKVHEIPQAGKAARGRAIVNLLNLQQGEKIAAFVNVRDFDEKQYVVMATRNGLVKKTSLAAFSHPRKGGINAITIRDDDTLIAADLTDGTHDIMLATRDGKAIRFNENEVREMGRTASGVRGISLSDDDYVIGMVIIKRNGTILVVTENGYGKRSNVADYPVKHRAGKGIITLKTTPKVGKLVSIKEVVDDDDFMIITQKGVVIRQKAKDISIIGRNTQGVRLIKLDQGDRIADVARVFSNGDEED